MAATQTYVEPACEKARLGTRGDRDRKRNYGANDGSESVGDAVDDAPGKERRKHTGDRMNGQGGEQRTAEPKPIAAERPGNAELFTIFHHEEYDELQPDDPKDVGPIRPVALKAAAQTHTKRHDQPGEQCRNHTRMVVVVVPDGTAEPAAIGQTLHERIAQRRGENCDAAQIPGSAHCTHALRKKSSADLHGTAQPRPRCIPACGRGYTRAMRATWKPHEKHGRLTTQSDLPDSVYAFPKERKEPLTDARHVRNAIARFDQVEGVSKAERDLAFANIRKAAEHYGVDLTERSAAAVGVHPQSAANKRKRTAARQTTSRKKKTTRKTAR
jgi:hypothetical protein